MTGKIIRRKVFDHGRMRMVMTLLFEEEGGLAISTFGNEIWASFNFVGDDTCQDLGVVQVSDELLTIAKKYATASDEIHQVLNQFRKLMEG